MKNPGFRVVKTINIARMAIHLTIIDPKHPERKYQRGFVQERVVIGRARSCDICLPDMAVSTRHFEIKLDGNDYRVVDLKSLNGTYIKGKKLVAHRPKTLRNGDVIKAVGFEIYFSLGLYAVAIDSLNESEKQAREMLAALLAGSSPEYKLPVLMVLSGPGKASRYRIDSDVSRLRIGRSKEADIRLEDPDVSRMHAELIFKDGEITVSDLGSRNGIVIGDSKVTSYTLEPGRTFRLGETVLALENPADEMLVSIQEAPEEQTSSFSQGLVVESSEESGLNPDLVEPSVPKIRATTADGNSNSDFSVQATSLPVGPSDPLDYPGRPGHVRTTQEIPRPETEAGNNSDLGLIIVGAIVVIGAVIGLIYLFT